MHNFGAKNTGDNIGKYRDQKYHTTLPYLQRHGIMWTPNTVLYRVSGVLQLLAMRKWTCSQNVFLVYLCYRCTSNYHEYSVAHSVQYHLGGDPACDPAPRALHLCSEVRNIDITWEYLIIFIDLWSWIKIFLSSHKQM